MEHAAEKASRRLTLGTYQDRLFGRFLWGRRQQCLLGQAEQFRGRISSHRGREVFGIVQLLVLVERLPFHLGKPFRHFRDGERYHAQ